MGTKAANSTIGKRIEHLLRHAIYWESERCYFTSSIDTARRAERQKLIEITSYRGKDFSQPLSKAEVADGKTPQACYYRLTEQGETIRDQLLSGTFTKIRDQRDQRLEWLLKQAAALHFTKTPEPDRSYTWDNEKLFLEEMGNKCLAYATNKLDLPLTSRYLFHYDDHDHYDSEKRENGLFCEAVAQDDLYQAVDITLSLLNLLSHRYPVVLTVALNVRDRMREFFCRALADYPRILSDIVNYPRCLRFECNVPLNKEPKNKRAAQPMEWLKAYFTPNESDDEEHFWLTTDFSEETSQARVRRTFLALVSLYESAIQSTAQQSQDKLLDYHRVLGLHR